MNKKFIIIPSLLLAIGGGAVLAQTDYFEAALANPKITASEAKEIALKEVNGEIISLEFDDDDDNLQPHYEIDVVKDNEKVELKVDANSGAVKVTERESINQSIKQSNSSVLPSATASKQSATISQQKAIDIALAKAAGTVTEIELDENDNQLVYEIEIRNGKMEYDFEIDAITGAIVEYKEDLED